MEKLQTLFLSVLLAVPLSCARPALAWDTETLSMENRVAQRKLNFVGHLKRLGENGRELADAMKKYDKLSERNGSIQSQNLL